MYSGKDAANTAYPTQWALNPTAYQDIDSSQVDWATLAQQWMAMKDAAIVTGLPTVCPPVKPDEEGEAPMEVENPDNSDGPITPDAEWNSNTNSWGAWNNQWGWGWPGSGPGDGKAAPDPGLGIPPLMDGYVPPEAAAPASGYTTTTPAPTFQHGYWTATQAEQTGSRSNSSSRDRSSKSKNRDKPRNSRPPRDKMSVLPPVIDPIVAPNMMSSATIDAAKRRQLPAWIREGLEKMEREKQRAIEREHEKKLREEAEKEQKRLEEEELERIKAAAGDQPLIPPKSKFESDSENEDEQNQEDIKVDRSSSSPVNDEPAIETVEVKEQREEVVVAPLVKRSKEEIMQEVMLTVRRSLTEILLEVTDQEIQTVSQEELARYTALQGLGAYESSSEESDEEDEQKEVTDHQLQEIIKRKRQDFERTSREIEAEVRRAEARENEDLTNTPTHTTPDRPRRRSRASTTPPPVDGETPTKLPERRISKDRRNSHKSVDKADGIRKLEPILEEKVKKSSKRIRSSSPKPSKSNNKESSTSSSDSENDSSSSSSDSSELDHESKSDNKARNKRRTSSSSGSPKKSKRTKHKKEIPHKSDTRVSKSKYYDDYDRSDKSRSKKKDDYYDRYKSTRSRDYDRKDKYRESSEERSRKRVKRSLSSSRSIRSSHRSSPSRSHRRYDRYERSRDTDRRRSRSGSRSRHRR